MIVSARKPVAVTLEIPSALGEYKTGPRARRAQAAAAAFMDADADDETEVQSNPCTRTTDGV